MGKLLQQSPPSYMHLTRWSMYTYAKIIKKTFFITYSRIYRIHSYKISQQIYL